MPSINTPTVESLHIYPIKSCHGVQVQECKVDNLGIKYDRQFMIIYADNNRFITQRKYTSLVFLHPTWDESNNTFTLSAKGQEPLHLPLTQDLEKLSKREVDLWKSDLTVYDMGDEAGDWVTQFLTNNRHLDHFNEPVRPVRLVTLDDPKNGVYSRQTHPQLQGIHSPFTDYSPISIGFTTSLQEVNKGLLQTGISQGVQIPMNRFRNNIIISGTVPWEEDQWLVAR
ncbi:uncharacterized protein EV154DRAFT_498286 [Mucor mucedo]|uniref:uncharacterized protein n=1 Tax=Mucor mucedo TaxID=29922 RepID=UPI00221F36A2|nr:uncharacterized protein EV154DRAFT_498286 [Mucor mucedo]KAI7894601.1 hypothetical protein EV154DRAFT_498286 [Mucor mucedo]